MPAGEDVAYVIFLNIGKPSRTGQLAHLNHNRSNSEFSNLVYLCLNHHDAFDSRTSQSKGYTVKEVEEYRERLYRELGTMDTPAPKPEIADEFDESNNNSIDKVADRLKRVAERSDGKLDFIHKPWKMLWLDEMQPKLFAYKSPNRSDGICRIERINLPDNRVVIVCEQIDGNPGRSVTNAIEYIAFQLCEQFGIDPQKLTLLEHYDTWFCNEEEWNLVDFEKRPPDSAFENPVWKPVTEADWRNFGFRPRRHRTKRRAQPASSVRLYKR